MLGDTAVAVNPSDERYGGLIGRTIELPLSGREIPVIGDPEVSIEFGTGAVKVTPAHDFNDFEISKRHGLPAVKVMDESAFMNREAGLYEGLDRFTARKKVVEDLAEKGLLEKTEDHKLMLGSCYRCSTVVEPTLSKQWFVKVGPLAEPAIKAVEDGSIRFVPKNWENTYFDWMRNIRDWCISRQIWWGHRIPAWHCQCGNVTVATVDPTECDRCGGVEIARDPDVLDTWFSSALWPFSTLGWPDKTEELKTFYPTSVLSTSFDIIFFWVARMIMMGLKFRGDVPFREVYIHALIRDAEGQKMSKSKGNVIDPLIMMEEYGTDAFRFTLAVLAAQGRDIKLAEDRVAGYRNFCNKLWNLARFTLLNVDEDSEAAGAEAGNYNTADKWILTRLDRCRVEVERTIERYLFDGAAKALYSFTWHELCDWYVELSKKDLRGENGPVRQKTASGVLLTVLKDTLKMLHPFMPFITEEVYSFLPGVAKKSIMEERFPVARGVYPEEEKALEGVMNVIRAVRNMRTEMNVPLGAEVECVCFSKDERLRTTLMDGSGYIKQLAKVGELNVLEPGPHPANAVSAIAASGEEAAIAEVFVPLKGLVDFEAELKRLEKEYERSATASNAISLKLSNEGFLAKAPEEVVEKERQKLEAAREKMNKISTGLERIKEIIG
jgi:valyl-tRNA synthetase